MDRTVPSAISEEIKLYRTTLYSLLRSSTEVQIRTLEEAHAGMTSLLHLNARESAPDTSALIYSLLRLPECLPQVRSVILGQSEEVFARHGYANVECWQSVSARARRRRCFFDGQETLACYIASRSDIEDIVPTLTAYQIEWNKIRLLLLSWPDEIPFSAAINSPEVFASLAAALQMAVEDLSRLKTVWGAQFAANLDLIRGHKCNLGIRLLSGSLSSYQRATHAWWERVETAFPAIKNRPLYFVSSNTHSLHNLLSGFALQYKDLLTDYIHNGKNPDLLAEWEDIQTHQVRSSPENFLYYILKKYQQTPQGQALVQAQQQAEMDLGILRIPSEHSFDLEATIIDLARIDIDAVDPRLCDDKNAACLVNSDAVILNIDYPLGLAAYNLLSKVAEQAFDVLGVYVMGKSASLNGVRGDVMIPNVVQDEHSHDTFLFQNCFKAADVAPALKYGTVLDHQKAICTLGTFLQNAKLMEVFYREGYADIEMEGGPYLSAVYEMFRPKRHPVNEIVNLYDLPFDLGILHYISDTPLNKGKNLGAGTLSYFGMDSTYACSAAILKRIFLLERQRLSGD